MARIVFMGTPDFAVPTLQVLASTSHRVVGVFTRPDQPSGRGRRLTASPVKQAAETLGLPVYQLKSLRKTEAIERLRELNPDLGIVAAYGLILPSELLAIPIRGFVNTHASLLPRHRGAAPIAAAILTGDAETGITLMQMDAGLDTGPILVQRSIPISPNDTTGSLTPKLAELAANLLRESLARLLSGEITPIAQDEKKATLFPTLKKEQGLLDWKRPAAELARRVRAFNPWPSAYSFWDGRQIRILFAEPIIFPGKEEPGRVISTKSGPAVVTGDGALLLSQVQLEGKRAMDAVEFARGQRDFVGSKLGVSA